MISYMEETNLPVYTHPVMSRSRASTRRSGHFWLSSSYDVSLSISWPGSQRQRQTINPLHKWPFLALLLKQQYA